MKKPIIFIFSLAMFIALQITCNQQDELKTGLPEIPEGAQAISLLGKTLNTPSLSESARAGLMTKLEKAKADYEANPGSDDALIWVGRRTAYLGQYREAINAFSQGIAKNPGNPRFYRHRGHRYVSVRLLDLAVADFEKAVQLIQNTEDEIEADGMPNARNIPTSTLHFNIWYHLGLAHYLKGDFAKARDAYEACLKVSKNTDAVAATSNWYYMTLRRLGDIEGAKALLEPIHADMDIIENQSYYQLLLFYKGELDVKSLHGDPTSDIQDAAVAYGLGNWHLYNGEKDVAKNVFQKLTGSDGWASFAYIAAEAELSRMQ